MNIADLSPVSMMPREHDNIEVAAFMQDLWTPVDRVNSNGKTEYLGQYEIMSRSTLNQLLDV
jgi:cyclopropane fatty-acyl-phospholipid synthase-like methyltransferase